MNTDIYEKYVKQVAIEGSLTKAAEKLGVSQPALSAGLTGFEKKLGFRIFNRSVSPVSLTPEGKIFYEYLTRKTALTVDFQNRIEVFRGNRDSLVTIGASVVYSESIVSQTVCRLSREKPDYSFSIRTAPLNRLIEMTEEGELDCFISTSDQLSDEFIKEEIKQEKIYLCIPKDRPVNNQLRCYKNSALPSDFISLVQDEMFIFLEANQPIQVLINTYLDKKQTKLKSSITVNQISTAVNLVSMGTGCCFASEDALSHPWIQDSICAYSMPEAISGRRIYAVWHRDFYQSSACRDFIKTLVNGNKSCQA